LEAFGTDVALVFGRANIALEAVGEKRGALMLSAELAV
jgi:hypothetical protein